MTFSRKINFPCHPSCLEPYQAAMESGTLIELYLKGYAGPLRVRVTEILSGSPYFQINAEVVLDS